MDESLQSTNYSSPAELSSDSFETSTYTQYDNLNMGTPVEPYTYNPQLHHQQMVMQMHAQMTGMTGYSTPMEQSPSFNNIPMGTPMVYPPYPMYPVPFWPQPFSADPSPNYPPPPMPQAYQTSEQDVTKHKNKERGRVPYTVKQLDILKSRFSRGDRIDKKERDELSKILDLSERQIKVWFQNRRYKLRNETTKQKTDVKVKDEHGLTELEH